MRNKAKAGKPASTELYKESNWPDALQANLSESLEENCEVLKEAFRSCYDVVFREVIHERTEAILVYIEGIVQSQLLDNHLLRPLLIDLAAESQSKPTLDSLEKETITLSKISRTSKMREAVEGILSGNAVLLLDGFAEGFVLEVKGGIRRSVEEPTTEAVIRGPREGFNESIQTNTSLIRFKIKSPRLKTELFTIGAETQTSVVLTYMEGIANAKVVEEARKRLSKIDIDSVLESGYIEEMIEDQPFSPFPQLQYSERPDTVAGQLLEGRFAIFVDGTPFVLTGPVTFWQFLQASEDYYERFLISTFIRWLRFMFMFIALFLPALYVATTTFHQDMLPTSLILSIAAARETIPFPAVVEVLILEISFEALREAGIRLPKTLGQAVSIVGALVIGQAAVEAGIVSAPMVIIVALTGIASFTIPRFNMAIAIRMLRFPLLILAAVYGLFGIIIGTLLIALHLVQLKSFGVPYMSGIAPLREKELKDILTRAPWWRMIFRPRSFIGRNWKRGKRPNY
ncbi:spore germination protein [Xylanibacillus composti]|uniref:Putative membrane protein YfkQ n=1 Tax=Xylanibacillus composti TaxID=1572762 RepID=A0A8J4H532_9BACL|nr:spore germination protein [Xylanibacillus composti]MDT9725729.1 spore germination protein [Xylanibacillus composti]GIQ71132.1 putative membrane protein YfkQ [Xylanibacillus composti]